MEKDREYKDGFPFISSANGLPDPNIKMTNDKPINNNSPVPNISKKKIRHGKFCPILLLGIRKLFNRYKKNHSPKSVSHFGNLNHGFDVLLFLIGNIWFKRSLFSVFEQLF